MRKEAVGVSLVFSCFTIVEGYTYEWCNVLETIRLPVLRRSMIPQDKRNFNDSPQASSHQSIPKHNMYHGTERQMLRMSRHSPTSQQNYETRNKIPLWRTVSLPAQPHTSQTRTPPNNTHSRMLDIVRHPRTAPSMFRESIDTSPRRNERRVEELLAASRALQPCLSHQHHQSKDDSVPNKGTSHNEMRQTLTKMILSTESQSRNPPKQHLHPRHDRHGFAHNPMSIYSHLADLAMETFRDVEFQVDSEDDLDDQH